MMGVDRFLRFARSNWVDIAWVGFIGLNLIAMRLIPAWQTVPFLIIWVSLTTIYGFRLWHLGSTVLMVAVVTLSTGALIGWQVLRGKQDAGYLAEVPLLATMFVVMVWHSRRRLAAMRTSREGPETAPRKREGARHARSQQSSPGGGCVARGHSLD